jgi:hypothetical protein
MKKLTLLFVTLLCLGFMFQACDDTKTYAEQLEDEDNAIKDFISKTKNETNANVPVNKNTDKRDKRR